jgi:carotenoid cleavage dioxygenase
MANQVETLIRQAVTKGIETVASVSRAVNPGPAEHPFLSGIHAPMREELEIADLPVNGTIPTALDGHYLRIGPNPVNPDPAGYHWFIGDGMVHGLRIKGGRALWYKNRWIRSNAVAKALGEEPAPGPRHSFDTVNTNVVGIGGRSFALVEAGSYPVELSADFESQTYNPFDGTLAGSFSAHPHLDPVTGENHAICYEGDQPGVIRHVVVDRHGKVTRELPIPVQHGPMIHDCAITARYAIILDLPVTFSMKAMLAGQRFPYRWNPEHQARVGLLPRDGGADEVIWCDVPAAFAFHVANAYDAADGTVVLDLCVYDSMFAERRGGPDARSRGLERWTIDPATRQVTVRTIDAAAQEFPRPDERFFGQPYRYAYCMALPDQPQAGFYFETKLYKHDLEAGTREVHEFGEGRYPGEFVFVPRAPDAPEGEGWLVGLVVDLPNEKTDFVIIDARHFESAPVASVRLPHRVPPGFHGNWIAQGESE